MPYARTSERAERHALREKMRARGLSHRQIAFEFARRYDLRPRAAWRHAHGWSLQQAACQITACATRAGLDAAGSTVAMTGPHLCEVEAWPGYGAKATGRRPTPYLLSLLAAAYDCTTADLLDFADYEHMRPADLLILGKAADLNGHGRERTPPAIQTRPRPVAQAVQGVWTRDGGEPGSSAVVLRQAGWELPHRQAGDLDSRRAEAPGPVTGLAGAGAEARPAERELIEAAAHQSSEHAGWAEASNVGEATLEQLDADVRRIARGYVHAPPLPMFAEMLRVRDRIYWLLAGRQKPAATAHLHLLAGVVCGLLANASTDLGCRDAAAEQARAAWAYGEIIGHNGLRAWTRGMQALIEYWSERPGHAVRLAQSARRYADSATATVRLCSIEARIWSRLGDAREVSQCMRAAAESGGSPAGSDYLHDEIGGVFGFGDAKHLCYESAAFMHLGQASAALETASRAVELYASGPPAQRSYGAESLARIDMAAACLLDRDLDGATAAMAPVLAIPPGLRIVQFSERLAPVRRVLAGPEFGGARQARDLGEQIDGFCGQTVAQQPHPVSHDH